MSLGRAIWTLDDVRTLADGGLSPARRRGMADAILARLGQHIAGTLQENRKLETELRLARAQIDGLERQLRAA